MQVVGGLADTLAGSPISKVEEVTVDGRAAEMYIAGYERRWLREAWEAAR